VRIVLNHKVTDLLAERDTGRFDAVFVAIGAHVGKHVDIPARDAVRVLDAVALLRDTAIGSTPLLGRRVVVYGGGNTAMDAARSLRRLGADEALIVYRRDRAHMPAHEFEADEALAEGVKIRWLTTIKEIVGSTLTTVVVFAPLGLLSGVVGDFFKALSITLTGDANLDGTVNALDFGALLFDTVHRVLAHRTCVPLLARRSPSVAIRKATGVREGRTCQTRRQPYRKPASPRPVPCSHGFPRD
jgi:hypothetical protein